MSKVFTITEGLENMGALRTGGQGSVYKGRRIGPIITAVKILPTPIHSESADDKNFKSFTNEVEKLKKVNEEPNPNVVKILNSGITESGSLPFIEMEYIEGPDLEELLAPPHEKIFTIKETIRVAEQLACALCHCHKVGVMHGDIKSNNVKFNKNTGNYVLLDFGLAVMSEEQRRTSMRHAGAIEFMAPEQNEGKMLFQTDVYSFGVILYELLAGQVPFPLKDQGETSRNMVMVAHMETPVPSLLELRKKNMPESWPIQKQERELQVPSWLFAIIDICLQKLTINRFANGMELQEAVTQGSILSIKSEPTITPLFLSNDAVAESAGYTDSTDNMIRLSKPVFGGLVGLMILFMGFSVYSLFYNKQTSVKTSSMTDTVKVKDTTDTSTQQKDNQDDNQALYKPVDTTSTPVNETNKTQQQVPEIKTDTTGQAAQKDTTAVSPNDNP
jgi:serine/threonine-protein kinase